MAAKIRNGCNFEEIYWIKPFFACQTSDTNVLFLLVRKKGSYRDKYLKIQNGGQYGHQI